MDIEEFTVDFAKLLAILSDHRAALRQEEVSMALSFDKMVENFKRTKQPEKMLVTLKQMYETFIKDETENQTEIGFILSEYLNTLGEFKDSSSLQDFVLNIMTWPSDINTMCLHVASKARKTFENSKVKI